MRSRRSLLMLVLVVFIWTTLDSGIVLGQSAQLVARVRQRKLAVLPKWPPQASINDMSCPGVLVCFVVGDVGLPAKLPAAPPKHPPAGLLAYTEDGGTSWTVRTDPQSSFARIACFNLTHCFILGRYRHSGTANGVLLMTPDGGKTWRQQPLPAGTNAQAIACPGITTCLLWDIVTIPPRSPQDTPRFRVSMLTTSDAGRNWKRSRTIATRPDFNSASVACPTVQVCYVYNGLTIIVKTGNGGKTWRPLTGTNMGARSGVPARTLANLGEIACPSALVCYTAQGDARCQCDAWGPYGTIFGTQDGGKQWVQLYRAHGQNYPEGSIACPGVNVCYAMGSSQRDVPADQLILTTKDAGRTWTPHKLGGGPLRLSCPGVSVCYAGRAFRTTDGGISWQPLP